ncbi:MULTISPECIES: hypothetical protein [Shinella]|jgi:hypothetical protein|uniref:Uncharacterized protein n=2 Tax=Shinella TaxID=323620 RepID=A0AA50D5A3_9HYPH|nr:MULTISPECIES: hypothetical protein [Shinella]MDP9591677.1 hypothetical protein [Shinella zoogloeoides]TFF00246.1 hypothetical protein B5M44_00680 [Shinella sumterensis]WLR97609.1 hypothetical protein Q9313_00830 [Shinella sumterensis]WLS03260.1 hypothetical protein Q9315_01055 [Shinella oryzae]WLS07377.1 hypothetical protein Q9314_14460 [Shinella sumterensis]
MNKTRIIAIATVIALAGAGQASAGGLLGLGILSGNKTKTGGIVIAPSVGVGVGNVLSDNNVLNGVLNNSLNGTLSGVLNGSALGILSGSGGSDCGCKKRRH